MPGWDELGGGVPALLQQALAFAQSDLLLLRCRCRCRVRAGRLRAHAPVRDN
jgi:hypothetical protein